MLHTGIMFLATATLGSRTMDALRADAILVITHSGPSIPSPVVDNQIVSWKLGR